MVENKLHIFKAFSNIISLSHCDNRFLNVTFELVYLNMLLCELKEMQIQQYN